MFQQSCRAIIQINRILRLSEASKILHHMEKGLHTAKVKSQSADTAVAIAQDLQYSGIHRPNDNFHGSHNHFPSNEILLNLTSNTNGEQYPTSGNGSRSMDMDEDEEDRYRTNVGLFPAKLIRKENQRNSFFRTILNPEEPPRSTAGQNRGKLFPPEHHHAAAIHGCLNDPITTGLIDENEAKVLFDLIFLRLNPFVNLFDPALHSVPYVRSKCPFLFTTMIMAACKFFKHDLFKQCQKLANDFAVRAFAEGWKRVEVVQAFACLTYWKDPGDNVCLLPSTNHTIDTHDAAHLDIHWICAFTPHFPHDALIDVYHNSGLSYGRRTGFEPPCPYSPDSRD